MGASGWTIAITSLLVWVAAIAWPAVAISASGLATPETDRVLPSVGAMLATSAGWSAAVALGAVVLGWGPGRLLASRARRGGGWVAAAVLVPICLPAYILYYCWWQSFPAMSVLQRAAIERDLIDVFHGGLLYLGLLGWAWPIAAWCVAGSASLVPAERGEMLSLDGAGRLRRLGVALRDDAPGLAAGALVAFVFVFGNTACFDIANIRTFGYEMRALRVDGAGPGTILMAGKSAIAVAAVGALLAWWFLRRPREALPSRPAAAGRGLAVTTILILVATAVVPFALIARRLDGMAAVSEFVSLYQREIINTIVASAAAGAISAFVAAALAMTWQHPRRAVRALADVQALGWLLGAIAPSIVVAVALVTAYNTPALRPLYDSPVIVVLAHLSRFAFIGAVVGLWLARHEPREGRWMRQLDGAVSPVALAIAWWPRLVTAAVAAAGTTAVLSMSEVIVTSLLEPPRYQGIAPSVLNAVHYQQPQTVLIAALVMLALGAFAACAIAVAATPLRRALPAGLAVLALAVVVGCAPTDPDDVTPLRASVAFGIAGSSPGQFHYPRGLAIDRERQLVYVVDKQARVQKLDYDGQPLTQWLMPAKERGKPTGLNVAPDGDIYVADTHYHRVAIYDPEGNPIRDFGEYGTGEGQFIYTTDVEFGHDGRLYVSEYGGNDRVQVFSPEGEFLFTFGTFGDGPDQFNRPQSMAFSEDGSELYIADACNHRIVVVDTEGQRKRMLGTSGREAGRLCYPYDVTVLPDGSLLVVEFGNHRIQRLDAQTGACLALYGGLGYDEGRLHSPWGVDGDGQWYFVLDSGNNRVQRIRRP